MKRQKPVHIVMGIVVVLFSTGSFALAQGTGVTEAEARRAALDTFPGEVTESETEREKGKQVFVFEIRHAAEGGLSTRAEVVVDAETGAVLAVETGGSANDVDDEVDDDVEGDEEDVNDMNDDEGGEATDERDSPADANPR